MKRIIRFVWQRDTLFLALLVLVSYGQLLLMQPWQEDNVIFFKVAHIEDRAGYLGSGLFGQGVYRYTATPYYFIYKIFGHNPTPFFGLMLFFYFLATASVYLLGRNLINRKMGMLAAFLFGSGYVAFDGFTRIYTSISISSGIIFMSLLFVAYWRFYKTKQILWYFLVVFFYWAAAEFSYVRAHYLIAPVLFFELIFLCLPPTLKRITGVVLRSIPFLFIFYKLYVENVDKRAGGIIDVTQSIIGGKLENTFSFFATLGNLVVPDKIQNLLLVLASQVPFWEVSPLLAGQIVTLAIFIATTYLIFRNTRQKKFLMPLFIAGTVVWFFVSREIFRIPTLVYSSPNTILSAFVGGLGVFLAIALILMTKGEIKRLLLFLIILITANIMAYSVYTPTTPYSTGYRYLAHSNVGWVIILALLATVALSKKIYQKIQLYPAIVWGLVLLILGVTNMNNIVTDKSNRIESFYRQLKGHVQEFPKGSLILFDIQDDPVARSWYNVSFSVAEMPNTTAIAWRYGIDRYDIKMFTEFLDLRKEIEENKVPLSKVYTFWLTKDDLYNTTEEFRKLAGYGLPTRNLETSFPESMATTKPIESGTEVYQNDLAIDLKDPLASLTPLNFELTIKALPMDIMSIVFPLKAKGVSNQVYFQANSRNLAFAYKKEKETFIKEANYSASSSWKERVLTNIHDGSKNTFWQADRVLWGSEKANVAVDLKRTLKLGGIAWVSGSANNTPIDYLIEISSDGNNWDQIASVADNKRIEAGSLRVVNFNPTETRFIRMNIKATLSGDSPVISELWPIGEALANDNIEQFRLEQFEEFIKQPFNFVGSTLDFNTTLVSMSRIGTVKVYWKGDKSASWMTSDDTTIPVIYDGVSRKYQFVIPPRGTQINQLKLSDITIPGLLSVEAVSVGSGSIN